MIIKKRINEKGNLVKCKGKEKEENYQVSYTRNNHHRLMPWRIIFFRRCTNKRHLFSLNLQRTE